MNLQMKLVLKAFIIIFTIGLFSPMVFCQTDVCDVTTYFVDHKAKASSGVFNIGSFCPVSTEDYSPSIKSYRHEETRALIRVGVEYSSWPGSSKNCLMKIVISVNDSEEDVFNSFNGSEARLFRDRQWLGFSVSKKIRFADRDYTYSLSCSKPNKVTSKLKKCEN